NHAYDRCPFSQSKPLPCPARGSAQTTNLSITGIKVNFKKEKWMVRKTMISNAPTDNLYKFITFLGITLLMFSIWTLSEIEKKNSENRLRAELELISRADNKEIDLAPINNEYRRLSILTQKYEILEDGEHRRRIENQIQQSQERIDLLRFELNSYITKIKEKNESTLIPGLYAVAPNPQKTILYLESDSKLSRVISCSCDTACEELD
ncbi:hypothetical protein KWJ32_27870, partial [Brucella sp. BTU2]|nr:hypothetical protein [Ochrobactrum sp. BTU2]